VWVHFCHGGGDGAAAADGHAQIVHRVCIGRVADGIELFQDSVHPIGKPTVLHPGPGGKGSDAGHEIPLTSVRMPWDDGPLSNGGEHRVSFRRPRVQRSAWRPVEILSVRRGRATLIPDSPEWRNWQTQQTQNLPKLCFVWGRLPPPGPFLPARSQETPAVRAASSNLSKKCAAL